LSKNEKDELFENCIQPYIQYLEELRQKGEKIALKMICHAWKSYKSKLVKISRDEDTPFLKYKDLKEEDGARFVKKCELEHFAPSSQYMQWLQSQNEIDHHLGNTSYVRKQRKWQKQDERMAQQGLENPYVQFCGRLAPFMCARSKQTKFGDVSFYS
jgi:hypothetical protein